MKELLLLGASLVCLVALYAAFATRVQLRRDWPARKVRVRDGSMTAQGPFRALEHTREQEVSAGPPWPVHLTALVGHGISPLSFFSTVSLWIYAWIAVSNDPDPTRNLPAVLMLAAVVVSFVLGRHQWRGSTVALTTDYAAALSHTRRAVLGRVFVDAIPLALMVAFGGREDYLPRALGYAIPTAHALVVMLAVIVSERHYRAVAIAREERLTDTFGDIPR
ncbi:MAG: hypothetical protein Q8Q09_06935 [Deltaproteobacteria bacterium]|nr:hypothetical protein [Deltaproteobacteria bacterium]